MFGAYVESFTSSVGYGAESSTMQMTLVEDPDNGITIKHSLDSGATFIDGFPEVGTVCQFAFEGFEFVGIFQRYSYSQSISGRNYDVTFESPSKILEGVQVILSGFEGTAFTGNYPFYPSEDVNFTSQLNNIYNPFGVKENYAWGGTFGFSDYNSVGFPVPDDPNRSGLAGKGLLTMIEEISQSKHTYDNPAGASTDTSVNANGEELIGGPICYGDSKFVIDFGNLKTLVPDFFRLKGPVKSINSIVNDCCELIVHDYVTIIDPVYTQQLIGYGTGIVPKPQYKNVIRNGVVPTQYDANNNVTGPVISFKYLDKSEQPKQGIVAQLVEDAKRNDTLISADNGREYADVVTQKLMLGDDATRVWEAGMEYLIPVYGKDFNGNWLTGEGFGDTDYAPVLLDGGGIYVAQIMELRCALTGFETWNMYHQIGQEYGYSNIASNIYSSIAAFATGANVRFKQYLANTYPAMAGLTGFDGNSQEQAALNDANRSFLGEEGGLYQAVLNTATQYWGKTYFVLLPVEPGGIENNLRYKNDFETEAAWEISDAGWDPDFRVKDIDIYNDEGALKACAGYYPSHVSGGTAYQRDFGAIERTLPYESPNNPTLVGSAIEVDKKIYWRNNPYYQNNNNPYDDVSAMVHITCPRVWEADAYATEKSAIDSLFAHATHTGGGTTAASKAAGYRSTERLIGSRQTFGIGHSNFGTMINESMSLRMLPTAVRPFKVSIPQKSTRYNWGPWYKFSTKIGKAEVTQDSKLKPETFGSAQLMDEAAFALAYAGTADLYASESGSVDLAEFPQYNIADRFNANGPYITKMDVSVGTGGITTKYQFSTWTRNFGKIAKYNIDRIAKANKDRIKALKRAAQNQPSVSSMSNAGVMKHNQRAHAMNAADMNFFMGLQVPAVADGGACANAFGASYWSMTNKSGASIHFDLGRKVKFHGQVVPSYDVTFGCTPEQLFSPVGIKRISDDGSQDKLPYVHEPIIGGNGFGGRGNDTYGAFYNFYASPTAKDLERYFFPTTGGGKLDIGAVCHGSSAQMQAGGNMHCFHSGGAIDSASKEVRTYGLTGPLLMSGWGYDVVGYPVPGDGAGFFTPSPAENRANWKTGPIDLKWDTERKVWAGGPEFLEGILTKAVKPAQSTKPEDADKPGNVHITPDLSGVMAIRRQTAVGWDQNGCANAWEWHQTDELIGITNRDPSLSVDPDKAEYGIYVMVARINYEWRIVYISCDNFEGA